MPPKYFKLLHFARSKSRQHLKATWGEMNSSRVFYIVVRSARRIPEDEGAKNVDLNSLRRIIEKTQNKLAVTSKPANNQNAAQDSKTVVTEEKVKIKPDPDAKNGERTGSGRSPEERVTNKGLKSPLKVFIKVEPDEKNNYSEEITTNSDVIEDDRHPAKRQKVTEQVTGETKTDYSCCFCKFSTKESNEYRSHIASHLKNKVLNCNSCAFSTDKISVYNNHVRAAHPQKRTTIMYACPMCSFKDPKMDALRRHQTVTGHSEHRPVQKCKICSYSNRNVLKMLEHILTHKPEQLIKECNYCDGKSSEENQHSKQCLEVTVPVIHKYEETIESSEQKKTFSCTLCDFGSEEQLFLVEHIKAHAKLSSDGVDEDDENPFSCSMCDFRCEKPNRLVIHMKTHKPGTVYRCKTCTYESADFEAFKAHRKLHIVTRPDGSKVFSCFICFMKFSKQETMQAHMKSHITPRPFSCHLCEFKCASKNDLIKHLKTHTKQKVTTIFFPCPLCPQKYSTSASLRTHLSNHSTESKPYQCDFCDYNCYTSELLRVHVQKHSGGNRFRCEICLVSYSSEAKLKAHIRDHLTTDKPLKCNICHTSFSSRAQLNRHTPIHSGRADPFICYVCPQSFPTLKSRRAHMLSSHEIENEEEWKSSQPIVVRTAADESETALDKYGYVEEDLARDTDSEEELLHPEQHHFIGYPTVEKENQSVQLRTGIESSYTTYLKLVKVIVACRLYIRPEEKYEIDQSIKPGRGLTLDNIPIKTIYPSKLLSICLGAPGIDMNHVSCRWLSVSATLKKEIAKNLKGRSKSSQDWLLRQLRDPYVEKARTENFRCRSAFKLLEINERFNILRPGQCVVDIGAAPGSWSQVAVSKTNSLGKDKTRPMGFVVGLDRLALYPVEGAVFIGGCDFTVPEAERRLLEVLGDRKVDVVLSDMAPNATGIKSMDHDVIISLVNKVLRFSMGISAEGGSLLMKVWEGRFCQELERDVTAVYETTRWVKPKSSRTDSAETFILGRGFKGPPSQR
ncbi:hypothetical protein GE061_004620 [Apolygus lucorum]|uniref:rRNA methyltransferase 2, mitochondrial n=1 Tax=Apolygus lucorum TaxID=248454 RepID=A0A8S9WZP9_APOLU|nr:hypothetical protein GE061_004620 [Apolygus lucorum]